MKINFTETGWSDYLYWEGQDKKTLKRINNLIEDIERSGHDGIGKPEALRNDMSGCWMVVAPHRRKEPYRLSACR